ncbi:MAG: hypothetical protein J5564_03265 [Clostridia bacterium]|nr:hypothetical protein [Clostridia bacterium]
MTAVTEILNTLAASLADVLVYGAIAVITIVGFVKCIFPSRGCARLLRRAVRRLEVMTIRDGTTPVWQDPLFLGKPMQTAWRRFLVNAEQLDSRGINCDVEDYINDDTVIYAHSHTQLGDVIPGILTSLGILGTFIGLVRGLGALNLSDAENTMSGISEMISGMKFAFGTSIAGCACSLLFNILNRAGIGSVQNALDSFYEAFTEFVMQRPLSDNVQAICQQEDRAAFLRHAVSELGKSMTEGVSDAVNRSMAPVTQSVSQYISLETEKQLEGLDRIVSGFVSRMNSALDSQLIHLGQTLSAINQSQRVDQQAMNVSLEAANGILGGMQQVSSLMQHVADRLDGYAQETDSAWQEQQAFADRTQELLGGMHAAAEEQMNYIASLRAAQEGLQSGMQQYADWSGRVLEAVHQQSQDTGEAARQVSQAMQESSRGLSESYASFVDGISGGLSRTMGLFEENMHGMISLLDSKLESIEKTAKAAQNGYNLRSEQLQEGTDGLIQSLSRLQRALGDMTARVEQAADALKAAETKTEDA